MYRLLTLLVALGLIFGSGSWILAQVEGDGRPLDLPKGKIGKDEEEEEDEPETIIFYGQEYESDAFFWCMDRSGSMAWGSPPPIQTLKQEVTQAINSLSRNAEFGLVAFGSTHETFPQPPMPVRANPSSKAAALAWVQARVAEGVTCMGAAGVTCVNMSNQCRKRNKTMIMLSDGEPNCPGCSSEIGDITQANFQRTPINTLFIGTGTSGAQCMQSLASQNGGSFTQIN